MFYIGTSGWQYREWRGVFYPEDLPSKEMFGFYQRHFETVEINSTFYHFPRQGTVENWHKTAKTKFIYTLKASRRITHFKRLKGVKEDLNAFFERIGLLRDKLGVLLYQLPPGIHKDLRLLRSFLTKLPAKYRHAIEFRHNSWFDRDVIKTLERHSVGYCIVSAPGIQTSFDIITADFAYIRMHGKDRWYNYDYTDDELKRLAFDCRNLARNKIDVYVYFNNTAYGYAVRNALALKEKI